MNEPKEQGNGLHMRKIYIIGSCYTVPLEHWTSEHFGNSYNLKPEAIGRGMDLWIVTPIFTGTRPKDCTVCNHSFSTKQDAIGYIKSHLIPLKQQVKG